MFEAWLFALAYRARLPDTVDFVLSELFSTHLHIFVRRGRRSNTNIWFLVQEAQNIAVLW